MAKHYSGSQKHLLDLLDLDLRPSFNPLLEPFGVSINEEDIFRPIGRDDPKEFYLPQFCKEFCDGQFDFSPIVDWWVPSQYRPPTWDLISTCSVNGSFGMLLVEAKAHKDELDWSGKTLAPTASVGSKENHKQIKNCIAGANSALLKTCDGIFNLAIDSHYQLTNRVAHLWKLACCNIPVVLLYLGFLGDAGIRHSYFRDDEHWQRSIGGYLDGVVPHSFLNHWHDKVEGERMLMLSKSLPIVGPSTKA